MSKYTFTVVCDDREELAAYTKAVKNDIKIETYYNDVLRPIRKYRDLTDEQSELLEEIIQKTQEHFYDDL